VPLHPCAENLWLLVAVDPKTLAPIIGTTAATRDPDRPPDNHLCIIETVQAILGDPLLRIRTDHLQIGLALAAQQLIDLAYMVKTEILSAMFSSDKAQVHQSTVLEVIQGLQQTLSNQLQ